MTSLGQMVAGIAHEINNPVNFIHANLSHVAESIADILSLMALYQKHYPQPVAEIELAAEEADIAFIRADLPNMLNSMKMGTARIREIILGLRNFSRKDEAAYKAVNIHEGIDSTLLILQHRLKATKDHPSIQVIREYGNFPLITCYASQLNQVFLNLLANAIDAIEEVNASRTQAEIEASPGQITIRTRHIDESCVSIEISDNGGGIPENIKKSYFRSLFHLERSGQGNWLRVIY